MSYNVKQFVGSTGECTIEAIGQSLAKLNPTVVCLNEVDLNRWPDTLERFGRALGVSNVEFYGHVRNGNYGNAVCSSLPLEQCKATQLKGGSRIKFEDKVHQIVRGLLVCSIDGSPVGLPKFTVAATHLDHMSEDERRVQLRHVREVLESVKTERNEPVVLCGDFNALKRKDYEDQHWQQLEDRHRERGWAMPSHGCLDELENHGYLDCFHYVDLDTPPTPTASVEEPLYRIDYCFAGPGFLEHFNLHSASVQNAICLSDHFPIVIDFSHKSSKM